MQETKQIRMQVTKQPGKMQATNTNANKINDFFFDPSIDCSQPKWVDVCDMVHGGDGGGGGGGGGEFFSQHVFRCFCLSNRLLARPPFN